VGAVVSEVSLLPASLGDANPAIASRTGGELIDAPGRALVGAKGEDPFVHPILHLLAFTRSRSRRDLKVIHENQTTSPGFSFTLCGNDVHLPGFTSSAIHSTYSSAPWSRHTLLHLRDMSR